MDVNMWSKFAVMTVLLSQLLFPVSAVDDPVQLLIDANKKEQPKNKSLPNNSLNSALAGINDSELLKKIMRTMKTVEWAEPIPPNFILVKTKDGDTLFSTIDGRFFIKGGMVVDGWNKRIIDTQQKAKDTWKATFSSAFGVTDDKLPIYYAGFIEKGTVDLYVMLDPLAAETNSMLYEQIQRLSATYKFAIILMPILQGKESANRGRELWCAKDQELAFELLMKGDKNTHFEILENCDVSKLLAGIGLAQFMRINRLPYLVSRVGFHQYGINNDLEAFINKQER